MILNKIFQRLGLSKGLFQTDKDNFVLWGSYKKVITTAEFFNFQQTTIKQNIINNFERVKRGLNSLSNFLKKEQYPKIININLKGVKE